MAASVVWGAKLWFWVKLWWREMWSVEQNRGFGSSLGGGKCGPGRETAAPGQARPRPSVVQGEKPRLWVKPGPAAVWSVEQNRGPGSTPAPPKHGPWSKTAPRVKPGPAAAWSSHLKYKKESKQTYERWIYQSRSDCPGQ